LIFNTAKLVGITALKVSTGKVEHENI